MGGGGGNPIKKALKPVKKAVKSTTAEVERQFDPSNSGGFIGDIHDATGINLRKTPIAPGQAQFAIAGQLKRQFVDKPREAKKAEEAAIRQAKSEQEAQLREIAAQERQSKAESEASEELLRRRQKQARRRKSSGRQSTILTDSLGGVGGEENQNKKTLLGS